MPYPVTHFIFVAGYEYSTKGLPFEAMCSHRAQEWIDGLRARTRSHGTFSSIRLTPPVTLRFLRFDFPTGLVDYFDFHLDSTGGKVVALTEQNWTPVADYTGDPATDPGQFCPSRTMRAITAADYHKDPGDEYASFISDGPHADEVMSIVDVYKAVQLMGQLDPFMYSLVELSFFSHGEAVGPVLVNSFDSDPKSADRDDTDKDGRRKDWGPNMGMTTGSDRLQSFVKAFDSAAGFVQAWGCVAVPSMRHVLVQAFIRRRMQSDAVGKALRALQPIDDDESFDFDFSDIDTLPDGTKRPWTDDYKTDKKFFPHNPSTKKFHATFLQIKQFLARRNAHTYVYQCALNTDLLAKGAMYGMEGDDEKHRSYNLMRVCIQATPEPRPLPPKWNPECPVGYSPYLKFMETYIGLKHDPERGYGVFDSDAVTAITKLTS